MAKKLASLDDIYLKIGQREILRHINLTLYANQILTIVGPNGAGKSTLLRILLGLQEASQGKVYLKKKIRLAYVPQKLQLKSLLPLTVFRFVMLAKWRAKKEEIVAVLEEVKVVHVMQQPVQQLSGGELQRVLLARALLRNPELLVLDEPAQGVDIIGQGDLYKIIAQVKETRGCGILMVSHDLHLVMANTDHVLCLNQHICCHGLPEDVSRHPEYTKLFGDLSGLAVYPHTHDHRHNLQGCTVPLKDSK